MRKHIFFSLIIILSITPLFSPMVRAEADNPLAPSTPVKLVFIHHSTGGYWLADGHGQLGIELKQNNYFVSDTDYGWGPGAIGDKTDIGNWYEWFGSGRSSNVLTALFTESSKNSSFGFYSRLAVDPGGENEIIVFKSCFPNSGLKGNGTDPIPLIGSNPLRGQTADSAFHTISNAKGIYLDLLSYFQTRPDKLFVVVAAPPLFSGTYAANIRAFNNWLMDKENGWLMNYSLSNVAIFDYYNILTTNGGNTNINDLNFVTGNHHRWLNDSIQEKIDAGSNVLAYRTAVGDDHPSAAGDLKASKEFVPLLNIFYHRWKSAGTGEPTPDPTAVLVDGFSAKRQTASVVRLTWKTLMAINTVGFHIYRRVGETGPGIRINQTLIQIKNIGSSAEVNYDFLDETAMAGAHYIYRLEVMERNQVAMTVGETTLPPNFVFVPMVTGSNP